MGDVHPFQGHFESTTQAFVDAFFTSGLSQWVTEFMFFRYGNILNLVFTSAIDRIGDVKIHCPFPDYGHCPIVFDYVYDFSWEIILNIFCLSKLCVKKSIKK